MQKYLEGKMKSTLIKELIIKNMKLYRYKQKLFTTIGDLTSDHFYIIDIDQILHHLSLYKFLV